MDWTLESVHQLISKQTEWISSVKDDCLLITNDDEIEIYLSIGGEQIIAESLLFPVGQVTDSVELNEQILKTHKFFPLTTAGIVNIDKEDYYSAFGALSSQSKAESIILEIDFLFQNVIGMLEAFEPFILNRR